MDKRQRTCQTRISVTKEQDELLSAYVAVYGKAERTLFAKLQAGEDINILKRNFQKRFGITARQFNAIHAVLKGKMSSINKRQPEMVNELKKRIIKARQVIKKTTDSYVLHQKKRRLAILQDKLKSSSGVSMDAIIQHIPDNRNATAVPLMSMKLVLYILIPFLLAQE